MVTPMGDTVYMKIRETRITGRIAIENLKSFARSVIGFDTHYIVSLLILFFVWVAFVSEFIVYAVTKLLIAWIETLATPLQVKNVKKQMMAATNLQDYEAMARQLDIITGRELWKTRVESEAYDSSAILKRTAVLRKARIARDLTVLLTALRETIDYHFFESRAGVLKENLYSSTYQGTKTIIEDFVTEVLASLEVGVELSTAAAERGLEFPSSESGDEVLGKVCVEEIDYQWGLTALVLSGGASLGWHHFGAVEPLLVDDLLPTVICGTSAGAAVAAWLCTRNVSQLKKELNEEYLLHYIQPLQPKQWHARISNFWQKGYCCDIRLWQQTAQAFFGTITFAEAYEKTNRILNITLTRADRDEASVILNFRNAPNVMIASAIIASCSFPTLGPPFHLLEKNSVGEVVDSIQYEGEYFHDGSIIGDIPLQAIKRLWGVKFAIVSQVNPHVFPFCGLRAHGEAGKPVAWRGCSTNERRWRGGFLLSGLEVIIKEHMRFLLRLVLLLDASPTIRGVTLSNLIQSYSGDITVHPSRLYWKHRRAMHDPTIEDAQWFFQEGRLMIYPKYSMIRNRLQIDKSLAKLKAAVGSRLTLSSFPSSR